MELKSGETAYQHKETVSGVICTEAQEYGKKICVRLLRNHNHTLLSKNVGGNNLPGTAGINRKDITTLSHDQHPTTSNKCAIRSISSTELSVWAPRRRPLCIIPEQEAVTILQLVSGQQSAWPERFEPQIN
ncbi:hypothetical protein AYI69_g383 [Smittium culicis]|uniref:Uncharacterized protein n=1 Tax=Smittium culicis TaxID=133412 RepID=A0A1R1YT75_9FUNG|nr:hypothetical protein AYI69_g383 [Smittium culicis]